MLRGGAEYKLISPVKRDIANRLWWVAFWACLSAIFSGACMGIGIGVIAGGLRTMNDMVTMRTQMGEMTTIAKGSDSAVKSLFGKFSADQTERTMGDVMAILTNTRRILEAVKANDVEAIKQHALATLERAEQIDTQKINAVAAEAHRIAAALDTAKINAFVDSTTQLETRLKNLHEIKVQI